MSYKKYLWGFGVVVAGVFATYWYNLGSISHEHGPWSSFGALLSGVFTLAGAGATIATLLFLNAQNQEQKKLSLIRDAEQRERERLQALEHQKITQAQLDTLTFERYMNHRKIFFERLTELQVSFDNKFVIVNVDTLYNKVFPENGPTHLKLKVNPLCGAGGENLIGVVSKLLNELEQMLDTSLVENINALNLTTLILRINGKLNIKWLAPACDGDIFFDGRNTGVNIYSINEFTHRIKSILNSFLFYTCNPLYEGFNKGNSKTGRESLMSFFIGNNKLDDSIKVHKEIEFLPALEKLYFETDMLRGDDGNWLLENTFRFLELNFQSRESVLVMRDKAQIKSFFDCAMRECLAALSDNENLLDNTAFRSVKGIIDIMSSDKG